LPERKPKLLKRIASKRSKTKPRRKKMTRRLQRRQLLIKNVKKT